MFIKLVSPKHPDKTCLYGPVLCFKIATERKFQDFETFKDGYPDGYDIFYNKESEKPIKEIREKKDIIKEVADTENELLDERVQLSLTDHAVESKIDNYQLPETYIREKYIVSKDFPKLRLISYTGQMSNKTYVVLEGFNEVNEGGLYILDQHAASERINKEKFFKMYKSSLC